MNFIPLSGENSHLLVTAEKNIKTKYHVLIDEPFWVECINPKPCFYKLGGEILQCVFRGKISRIYLFFIILQTSCFQHLLLYRFFSLNR